MGEGLAGLAIVAVWARAGRVPTEHGQRPVRGTCLGPGERSLIVLWTILVVLVIVALVLFILGRVRGGRGV
jgi:hypothetical protein